MITRFLQTSLFLRICNVDILSCGLYLLNIEPSMCWPAWNSEDFRIRTELSGFYKLHCEGSLHVKGIKSQISISFKILLFLPSIAFCRKDLWIGHEKLARLAADSRSQHDSRETEGRRLSVYGVTLLVWRTPVFSVRCCLCESLDASFLLCYKQLGKGWDTSKHNCLVSYLLCWRHVSATVDHLQVTKIYKEENYTEYNHSIGAYS